MFYEGYEIKMMHENDYIIMDRGEIQKHDLESVKECKKTIDEWNKYIAGKAW